MGTPATTTLGMTPTEMKEIGSIIYDLLKEAKVEITKTGEPSKSKAQVPEKTLLHARDRVAALNQRFPLYPELVIDEHETMRHHVRN